MRKSTRSRRRDGRTTQKHLLETAGRVFAEFGYSATSAKMATERAGLNPASVNYYFGGKRGLYEAALREAISRVNTERKVFAAARGKADPRARFSRALTLMVGAALSNQPEMWHSRLLVHALIAPTPLTLTATRRAVKTFAQPFLELVGEILGLPANHQVTQRAVSSTTGVILAYILLPPDIRDAITPAVGSNPRATGQTIVRCALAGLDAIRSDLHSRRARPARGRKSTPSP